MDSVSEDRCAEIKDTAIPNPVSRAGVVALPTVAPECLAGIYAELTAAAVGKGRLLDVVRYAGPWIAALEKRYASDDPVFLRPLAALCSANVGLNYLAAAERVFARLEHVRADNPADRALVRRMAVAILVGRGKPEQAEIEMHAAIADEKLAGRFGGIEEAWAFHQLGRLYLQQGRYREADAVVAHAVELAAEGSDSHRLDYLKMLEFAAVIDARQGRWRNAESKLARATAVADAGPELDAAAMRELLFCHAAVLHKLRRGRDARAVEQRLALLPPDPARGFIDISQFEVERGRR